MQGLAATDEPHVKVATERLGEALQRGHAEAYRPDFGLQDGRLGAVETLSELPLGQAWVLPGLAQEGPVLVVPSIGTHALDTSTIITRQAGEPKLSHACL